MSLFVAVRPDAEAVEDLQHALDRVRRLPLAEPLRWQPPAQWHVTMAFLGADDPAIADEVGERLTTLSSHAPVDRLVIAGAGCFGRQILWMDLADAEAVAALAGLAAAIPPLLRGSGATVDRRPWRPHLTVARARHGDARGLVPALDAYRGTMWTVSELLLIRSTGGPHPDHHVMRRIALDGRTA